MIKHATLRTVVATAGLLYTALTHETDLAKFDPKRTRGAYRVTTTALARESINRGPPTTIRAPDDGLRRAMKTSDCYAVEHLFPESSSAKRNMSNVIQHLHSVNHILISTPIPHSIT